MRDFPKGMGLVTHRLGGYSQVVGLATGGTQTFERGHPGVTGPMTPGELAGREVHVVYFPFPR